MRRWMTKHYQADWEKISQRYQISEIMAEVLVQRGLVDWRQMDSYLYPEMKDLADPCLMKDIEKTAAVLEEKIAQKKKILIVGDYDVDGVMSTYILYQGIARLGGDVVYRLPNRKKDGYGLRPYMIQEGWEAGCDTVLTCDNGVSSGEAAALGRKLGMTVLVTDHHEIPRSEGREQLPPADCIVDPKQEECRYPYSELCGAGVAYRLLYRLYQMAGREEETEEFLPFVAIATVCDVVPLLGENRILVKNGMDRIAQSSNLGLQALLDVLEFTGKMRASFLGFRLGPCLNAAGRMEDPGEALELFLSRDPSEARKRAERLASLNEERKECTFRAYAQAVDQIEEWDGQRVLVLFLEDCQESVAGIVAGRIREKYYRPTLVITRGEEGLKGSGRSIPGYHMQQEIEKCAELLTEYGGHAMAAGFSLPAENLDAFREKLNRNCTLGEEELEEKIFFDREVPLGEMTEQVVRELEWLEPVGEGNPSALFADRNVEILGVQLCGRENQIARLKLREKGEIYSGVDFHWKDRLQPAVTGRYGASLWEELVQGRASGCLVDFLYRPRINQKFGGIDIEVLDCR